VISNITLGSGEAYGDITRLPAPYFEDKPEYAGYPSFNGPNHLSHDILVDIRDIDSDGRQDILVNSVIYDHVAGFVAGVVQILHNKGNLQFEDVTDTSLYNFFLGKASGHEAQFVDVNGDGFPDILIPQHGGAFDSTAATAAQTWANQILINTGTGKFVQAMWNEFHEMTISQEQIVPDGFFLRQDSKYTPYLLPDRRLGFIASQDMFLNGVRKTAFFDFRAHQPLSTGPNGTDPALHGAPGFSEYFYLTEYPDVAAAVATGQYTSGLAHYLAVGRNQGREAFAPNATIRGSMQTHTLILNGPRSNFTVSGIVGGYRLKDNIGRYGTLTLFDIEHVRFSDTTIALGSPSLFGDFDGDGKVDVTVYRDGAWYVLRSSDGGAAVTNWGGLMQDVPVLGDYDGDGKADVAVYRDGIWFIQRSTDGGQTTLGWGGVLQDVPVPANFDGDGKIDVAVYRRGIWFIRRSSDTGMTVISWGGAAQDVPLPADYDGDGKADAAVYRQGIWFIRRSSDTGMTVISWGGAAQDVAVPADYDGDGKTDAAVYRNGIWFIRRSTDMGMTVISWGGAAQDVAVPADYDGDGRTDIGVYRNGIWFILRSSDSVQFAVGWGGAPQDVPLN
jgi:hypothetical protein